MLKLVVAFAMLTSHAWAFSSAHLYNNKEAVSHNLSKRNFSKFKNLPDAQKILSRQRLLIADTLESLKKSNQLCELPLGDKLLESSRSASSILYGMKVSRAHNEIDDIFLDLVKTSLKVSTKLKDIESRHSQSSSIIYLNENDLTETDFKSKAFFELQNMFNKDNICLNQRWNRFSYFTFKYYKAKKFKSSDQRKMIKMALTQNNISLESSKKAYALIGLKIRDWKLNLKKYLDISLNAKDIYKLDKDVVDNNLDSNEKFTTKHYEKLKKISRRKELYKNYTTDQIMMLAQLMRKVNVRMSVESYIDNPSIMISYSYTDSRTGEVITENNMLSYEDQINWARRMLRKDMLDLQNSRFFKNSYVSYEMVITATIETGVISLEEISYVLTYDDLWNPHTKPWHKIRSYLMSLGGTLTIFLPPPYNILGSLGLVLVQSQIELKQQQHSDQSHANKVIN